VNLSETFKASFKGAPFLVSKGSTAGGRKDVLHQYPNSNRQNVEDLGLRPRTLTVEGIINSPNYVRKRDQLLEALESGGVGLLVHPFFGNLENMVCRSFSLSEDFTELGEGKISMNFTVSDGVAIPVGTKNNASYLNGLNNSVQDSMNKDISKGFKTSASASIFESARATMKRMFDKIDSATKIVSQATDQANAFSALVNDLTTSINDLARKPQAFADSITNVFANINGLYAVASSVSLTGNQSVTSARDASFQATKTLAVYSALFDFDDNVPELENRTQETIRRNLNDCLLKQQMQLSALGFAYLNSSQIIYSNVNEIDEVARNLEIQFQKIVKNNDCIAANADMLAENVDIDQTSLLAIQDLRDATQTLFDEIKLTTSRIIEIKTEEMPAPVLAFQYYGSLDLQQEIIELNPEQNVSFFAGNVSILSP